jgi:hypothetical protein
LEEARKKKLSQVKKMIFKNGDCPNYYSIKGQVSIPVDRYF